MTYVKRTYFPFVLREPQLWSDGARVAGALWGLRRPSNCGESCLWPRQG